MQKGAMFDWDDIRLFLEVAEAGSTLAASRRLGINQTTISRRMDSLEHALGLTLFNRLSTGYALTEQGAALCDRAAEMRAAAGAVLSQAEALRRNVSGSIRISAPEALFPAFVAPVVAEFRREFPAVQFQFDSSQGYVDLMRGAADLALRAADAIGDDRLIAQKIAPVAWTAYCSTAYARANGVPTCPEEVATHPVVTYVGQMSTRSGNLAFMRHVDARRIVGESDSVSNMTAILRAGIGIGILPCFQGDQDAGLQRCFEPVPAFSSTLWFVTTPGKRALPRIDAFLRTAARHFPAYRRMLSGRAPAPGEPGSP
jgi:DNA-binding transcriptional LysR family regulator